MSIGDRQDMISGATEFLRLSSDIAIKSLQCVQLAEAERLQASITGWENLELAYEQLGLILALRPHRPHWHRDRS